MCVYKKFALQTTFQVELHPYSIFKTTSSMVQGYHRHRQSCHQCRISPQSLTENHQNVNLHFKRSPDNFMYINNFKEKNQCANFLLPEMLSGKVMGLISLESRNKWCCPRMYLNQVKFATCISVSEVVPPAPISHGHLQNTQCCPHPGHAQLLSVVFPSLSCLSLLHISG